MTLWPRGHTVISYGCLSIWLPGTHSLILFIYLFIFTKIFINSCLQTFNIKHKCLWGANMDCDDSACLLPIISRLDYCNSILNGVGAMHLRKLQSVHNVAARVIARKRKYDHITSTLRDDLHWLQVESWIRFKQCMLVCKSLHGIAPIYIVEMCFRRCFDSERYQLRSAVRGELVVPLAKIVTLGRRSFRYAGPSLWNALARDIRDVTHSLSQFQSKLKTFLYREVYHLWLQKRLRDGFVIRRRYINSVTN